MTKKFIKIILLFFFTLQLVKPVAADENKVKIYFFWNKGCPHCAEEKRFLESLEKRYSGVEIGSFEVGSSQESIEVFQEVGRRLSVSTAYIPFTVVGEEYFVGYLDDETTGRQIEKAVACALENGCVDIVADLVNPVVVEKTVSTPETLKLPLIGEIRIKNLSLPTLTLIIALLDGFNPCAMWALLFLISLLLGMKDRKRMWALGTTFIIVSGIVYFFFLAAWLNLFLFLGFVFWVRIIVGLVALGAGGYHLRDFWLNREGGCEAVGEEKREKIFAKMRKVTQKKRFLFALGGIILLAVAVNLIELVCSAGLPAIYTQILALNQIPRWQYYLYLLFYIFVFMCDDLVVFFMAMLTLRAVGVQSRYARYSRLIGGGLMLIIGLLLIFKPDWLIFG